MSRQQINFCKQILAQRNPHIGHYAWVESERCHTLAVVAYRMWHDEGPDYIQETVSFYEISGWLNGLQPGDIIYPVKKWFHESENPTRYDVKFIGKQITRPYGWNLIRILDAQSTIWHAKKKCKIDRSATEARVMEKDRTVFRVPADWTDDHIWACLHIANRAHAAGITTGKRLKADEIMIAARSKR